MATRLIELSDGTLVEIEAIHGESREISGGFAEKVGSTLEGAAATILKTMNPIIRACQDMQSRGDVQSTEVELGFSFEAEGNLYIAKAKSTATIIVRIVPKSLTT
ncbi:CU044_2847 family protein [Streptosporangium sp. NPDC023963]|uniref:CU044_2847 family protein n=1 Tax=Streptosporangium sp. NPDC023963 TaxID=3155608 RepID=UPI003448E797